MRAIIARNNKCYIGLNGELPWKCKADLLHFKQLTMNNTLLVGYKTYQTLPKLKDRIVIVDNDNIDVNEIDWCIGGKKTYEKYCQYFTELHISIVDDDTIGDTMFPDLKNLPVSCKIFYYNFKKD